MATDSTTDKTATFSTMLKVSGLGDCIKVQGFVPGRRFSQIQAAS
jgi:hypothetical protein